MPLILWVDRAIFMLARSWGRRNVEAGNILLHVVVEIIRVPLERWPWQSALLFDLREFGHGGVVDGLLRELPLGNWLVDRSIMTIARGRKLFRR
jgi:hypothetical protein